MSFLMEQGIQVSPPAPNPWEPTFKVWTVSDEPKVRALIDRFMEAERREGR